MENNNETRGYIGVTKNAFKIWWEAKAAMLDILVKGIWPPWQLIFCPWKKNIYSMKLGPKRNMANLIFMKLVIIIYAQLKSISSILKKRNSQTPEIKYVLSSWLLFKNLFLLWNHLFNADISFRFCSNSW